MAASARQIEANRRNAAGPHQMTEAGKQSVRANTLRHGLITRLHVAVQPILAAVGLFRAFPVDPLAPAVGDFIRDARSGDRWKSQIAHPA